MGAESRTLDAAEDDRARTVGLDDLAGRLQLPVCFYTELYDRVGAFLFRWPEALVGVGRVEKFGRRIEAKKAGRVPMGRSPAHRRQRSGASIDGKAGDAIVAPVRRVDEAAIGGDGDLGAAELASVARRRG